MSDVIIPASSNKSLGEIKELKPSSWLTSIEFVKRLTFDNNILVAVLGEKGSGKTSFTKLLHEELESQIKTYVMKPAHLFNRGVFLEQMREHLGITGDSSILNLIQKVNEQQQHVLLVVDDAHYLTSIFVEEILSELHRQEKICYFHVCLVSDFSLVTVLNRLAKHTYKDMVHSIELGPLSEGETKQYVFDRNFMRPNIDKIVTDARIRQFYQLTAGHLVDINRQMTSFFRNKAGKYLHNDPFVRYLAVAAGVLIVTIGATYVWRSQDFQSVLTAWANQSPVTQLKEAKVAVSAPKRLTVYTSRIPSFEEAAFRQEIQAIPLRKADLVLMEEEVELTPSLSVIDKVIVAPKIIQIHPDKKVADIRSVSSPKKPFEINKTEEKKAQFDRTDYTIQILASFDKKGLKQFVKGHNLGGKVRLCHTMHHGKDWYVIILGHYKSRQSAMLAFKTLPIDMAQHKPWVRLVGDLKVVG